MKVKLKNTGASASCRYLSTAFNTGKYIKLGRRNANNALKMIDRLTKVCEVIVKTKMGKCCLYSSDTWTPTKTVAEGTDRLRK